MNDIKPIFVLGVPRSGTTLIGNYIGSGLNICNLGEFAAFYFTRYVAMTEFLTAPAPYKEQYVSEMKQHTREFAARTAAAEGCNFYCDSTPWNLLIVSELAEEFPDAVFVLTLRHYSGVLQSLARSYREGHRWVGATWQARAHMWRHLYSFAQGLPTARTAVVGYDALCAQPERTVASFNITLKRLGLEPATLDQAQFAISHANKSAAARPVIAQQLPGGGIKLRPIASFDAQAWNRSIEEIVQPIVEPLDNQLSQQFPDHYAAPESFRTFR